MSTSEEKRRILVEVPDLSPRLARKTVRKGRNKYRYVTLLVEAYGRKLPDTAKLLLLSKNVRARARLVLEFEVEPTAKKIEPKRFQLSPGIYIGHIQYFKSDMDHYEAVKIVVKPCGKIRFTTIESDYGPSSDIVWKYPRIWDLEPMQIITEAEEYFMDTVRSRACPLCGHELLSFSKVRRFVDDYTLINMWRTGRIDKDESDLYYCPICNMWILDRRYTWDAGSVLNWELEININGRVYRCVKTGITDDDTLLHYYRDFAKFALEIGLIRVVTNDPAETLNNILQW